MATSNVYVTVVDVGQGQCTFVEVYDNSDKLVHTLLIDCGTDKDSSQTEANLQKIADIVSDMETPTIDCIVFSHSDKDHISLTKSLLAKFKEEKKPKVKKVWYGGDYDLYTKNSFNILNYLKTKNYCDGDDIKSPGSNYSDYNPETEAYNGYLWKSDDSSVYLRAIAGNVLSDNPDWDDQDLDVQGKTAEAKNRVSIICGLYFGGASYVICGDATNTTMSAFNQYFKGKSTVFGNNVMTTLPHHGSRATGYAVKSGEQASLKSLMIVSGFSTTLKSKTITVSAYQKHRHPSLYLMYDFLPGIKTPILKDARLKQKNAHRVTANVDFELIKPDESTVLQGYDYTFDTTTNTFSTQYNILWASFFYTIGHLTVKDDLGLNNILTAINPFACWRYKTASNGSFALAGYPNLTDLTTPFTSAPDGFLSDDVMEGYSAIQESIQISSAAPKESEPFQIRIKPQRAKIFNQPSFNKHVYTM
jgi:hypothetical protein